MTQVAQSASVLVVNAGSSSLKYQLIGAAGGAVAAAGTVEKIGEVDGVAKHVVGDQAFVRTEPFATHREAFDAVLAAFAEHGPQLAQSNVVAVGHRVVHGGARFSAPVVIDDEVVAAITDLVPLAPLHNPANLEGIAVARASFADIPSIAVFDTAFHATMPPHAYTYAVPREWRRDHGVRRYGFHGTSHAYVSRRAAELLGRPEDEVNVIVLHLGNGASACAVQGGRSIDTSMGLSPAEGLVMGTRPGDVDPALPIHMTRSAGLTLAEYDRALNSASGLKGLTGTNDFREVRELAEGGDADAQAALDIVAYRLRKYAGAYAAALGRVDAIVFTGGIGEHNPGLRASVITGLGVLGCVLDPDANAGGVGERLVTASESAVAVYVIPTNEEWEIARQCLAVLASAPDES